VRRRPPGDFSWAARGGFFLPGDFCSFLAGGFSPSKTEKRFCKGGAWGLLGFKFFSASGGRPGQFFRFSRERKNGMGHRKQMGVPCGASPKNPWLGICRGGPDEMGPVSIGRKKAPANGHFTGTPQFRFGLCPAPCFYSRGKRPNMGRPSRKRGAGDMRSGPLGPLVPRRFLEGRRVFRLPPGGGGGFAASAWGPGVFLDEYEPGEKQVLKGFSGRDWRGIVMGSRKLAEGFFQNRGICRFRAVGDAAGKKKT